MTHEIYQTINVTVGSYEYREVYIPIVETISIQDQKDWVRNGGTIAELIDFTIINS